MNRLIIRHADMAMDNTAELEVGDGAAELLEVGDVQPV